MDYTKFPKHRGQPRSFEGERQARFLDTLGAPSLHRRNLDGSLSSKVNGRLYVDPAKTVGVDGYYSLGTIDGALHVLASATARGTFADRGAFTGDDGFTPDSINRLYHYSRGWGAAVASEGVGVIPDFNAKNAAAFAVTEAKTRNGRAFTTVEQFLAVLSFTGGVYDAPLGVCLPTVLSDTTQLPAGWGFIGITVDGDYVPVYMRDDNAVRSLVVLPALDHQLLYALTPSTLAPRRRIASARYVRPLYSQVSPIPPHVIVSEECPGLLVYFSDDGGATWWAASSIGAYSEIEDTLMPMVVLNSAANWSAVNTLFNKAVAVMGVGNPAPISGRYALSCSNVPYAVVDGTQYEGYRLKCKAKLVLIDSNARTVFETATLLDDEFDVASRYFGTSVAIGGGMLFQVHPPTEMDYRDDAVDCWFTTDGTDAVLMGTMPQPAWKTGALFALDANTVGCTMYDDAGYSLYQSTDLGATWTRRALIAVGTPPEKVLGANYLIDFEYVTQLRVQGRNANAMPGAPWATDERIDAPIL